MSSPDTEYPEQKHTGKVGYGPLYHRGPTTSDKIQGLKEEFKGKLTHKQELVERGHERITGELKQKEQEKDMTNNDPFAQPEDKDHGKASPVRSGSQGGAEERAAGTQTAKNQ